jgi:hypothetical protein
MSAIEEVNHDGKIEKRNVIEMMQSFSVQNIRT